MPATEWVAESMIGETVPRIESEDKVTGSLAYLKHEIEPQEAISEGHIHSHFSHLFQTRERSNSSQGK